MADEVIKWYHFALGHCGAQRLYDTISNRFYLKGLNELCKSFVCPIHCNASKTVGGKEHGKLPAKQARLVPWDEVHVDCIGPWTITASDGAEYKFNALTCIDPVTNLVDIIRLNGSNPKAGYCGQRFEICWLSRYP